MGRAKICTEDGKMFVYDFQGGFAIGRDTGYEWEETAADEVVSRVQPYMQEKLVVRKVA